MRAFALKCMDLDLQLSASYRKTTWDSCLVVLVSRTADVLYIRSPVAYLICPPGWHFSVLFVSACYWNCEGVELEQGLWSNTLAGAVAGVASCRLRECASLAEGT